MEINKTFSNIFTICIVSIYSFSFVSCGDENKVVEKDGIEKTSEVSARQVFGANLPVSAPNISYIEYNDKGQVIEMITKNYGIVSFDYVNGSSRSTEQSIVNVSFPKINSNIVMTIGSNGFVSKCTQTTFDKYENKTSNDSWYFRYNENGQMIYMYRSEGNDEETSINYNQDGDIINIKQTSNMGMNIDYTCNIFYTSSQTTSKIENSYMIMMFDELFRIDLDEMYVAYWAGLLGKPTKHLPVGYQKSNYNDSETHEELFEWELDSTNKPLRLKTSDEIFIF